MPAYWSLSIEFEKSKIRIEEFYDRLAACGVSFSQGYWKSAGSSYEEVIANHQYFAQNPNFDDGPYCQDLFRFNGFSEVRGIWRFEETALFELIIPEDDFLFWDSDISPDSKAFRNTAAMDAVKDLAIKLWEKLDLLTIQTAWECSDIPHRFSELRDKGYPPQAEPFAIVNDAVKTTGQAATIVGDNGVLVENDDNWLFC